MFNNLPFGSVVKVKSGGRHDTDLMPLAVTLTEGTMIWDTNYVRYYAVFLDKTQNPTSYGFAKLYSNEIESIVGPQPLKPLEVAKLQSDADESWRQ